MTVISSTAKLSGRYEIVSSLGIGGMAEVFLARDTDDDRMVAIKFPHFDKTEHRARARFMREAHAIEKLNHPNVAKLYEVGEEDDKPFLVMEYVEGETLSEKIFKGELTIASVVQIITQTAEALTAAHGGSFIHRDLKPSNVMITKEGTVKVLDFGLAKPLFKNEKGELTNEALFSSSARTLTGVIVGTPMYLSPEQATELPVDQRSDIFSLGALLYECLTSVPAFTGNNVAEIIAKVLRDDPQPPSQINKYVPPELDRITLRALEKRPENRFQSVNEFLEDIRNVNLSKNTDQTIPNPLKQTLHERRLITRTLTDALRKPRLSLATFLIGSLVLASLLFLGYWLFMRSPVYVPHPEAKKRYDKGVQLIQQGAYYTATAELQEAIKLDPNYVLARARLAETQFTLDDEDQSLREIVESNNLLNKGIKLNETDLLTYNAINATISKDYAQTVHYYEELAKNNSNASHILLDLASAYEKNGEFDKALAQYRNVIDRNPNYATAYFRTAMLYARRKEIGNTIALFQKTEELYKAENNLEGLTNTLTEHAIFYIEMNMTEQAAQYTQRAMELAKENNFVFLKIRNLLTMSSISLNANDFDNAKKHIEDATELARVNSLDNLEILCYLDIGKVHIAKGDNDEALKSFETALKYAERIKARFAAARALTGLAAIYLAQGKQDEALSATSKAAEIYEKYAYISEAITCQIVLAQIKYSKGEYQDSLDMLQKNLQKARSIGDPNLITLVLGEMAVAAHRLEHFSDAVKYADESARINLKIGYLSNYTYSAATKGDALSQLGLFDEAKKEFDEALKTATAKGQDVFVIAWIYNGYAEAELRKENYAKAIKFAETCYSYSKDNEDEFLVSSLTIQSMTNALNGNVNKAKEFGKKAVSSAENFKDPNFISRALLALSLAKYKAANYSEAVKLALQAKDISSRIKQQIEEFRALYLLAVVSEKLGDKSGAKSYANEANSLLEQIKNKLGESNVGSFMSRPDITSANKEISQILSKVN